MANKYWELEEPIIARSKKNVARLYKDAGMLHISKPDWTTKDGKILPGKTIVLNINAFKEGDSEEFIGILNGVIGRVQRGA